ncbi:unnamed protein product [Caenorhabditis brenneri]
MIEVTSQIVSGVMGGQVGHDRTGASGVSWMRREKSIGGMNRSHVYSGKWNSSEHWLQIWFDLAVRCAPIEKMVKWKHEAMKRKFCEDERLLGAA